MSFAQPGEIIEQISPRLAKLIGEFCPARGANKSRTKPRVDDDEEEVPIKRRGPYETKKCGCPFKLKGEQMTTSENRKLFVYDGRHNHAIGVYNHGHAQAAELTEEQLIQTEQFRKSRVPPRKTVTTATYLVILLLHTDINSNDENVAICTDKGYDV
ncbi:hypothetical protein M9H77_22817 [Catharanthus roseus]|uniref:Uncharacterized protein n=1 Tax=Catharanthus roseus TaxID=4058 RepID=A0ACC0ATQ0_CATRO|nr:hypothetical protein M9H77_22817 [Catharanthus roseus]